MKLYMQQKFFSWKDRAWIKDANGEERYFVEGKVFSFGKKLRIMDTHERELAFVHEKVMSLMPRFFVQIDGKDVVCIHKKFTFLKPKYVVEGLGWDVQGEFLAHDYTIYDNGRVIVTIHKKWMSWGDAFELDVADGTDEVLALAVVLAIDAVMDAQQAAAAASTSSN